MLLAVGKITDMRNKIFMDDLYRKYYQTLCKTAASILKSKMNDTDIVTNAMLSLFSKIDFLRKLDERERVAYLRATVRNAAYKEYNAQKHRSLTESVPFDSALFSLSDSESIDPAMMLQQKEEYQQVRDAIAVLPEADRQLLYLKYSAQFTAKEIAEMTNAPSENAVNVRLSRARHKVLLLLQERGWEHDG